AADHPTADQASRHDSNKPRAVANWYSLIGGCLSVCITHEPPTRHTERGTKGFLKNPTGPQRGGAQQHPQKNRRGRKGGRQRLLERGCALGLPSFSPGPDPPNFPSGRFQI